MKAHDLIPYIDLTSLGDNDTASDIDYLCEAAITPFGKVAAVCVWPKFVAQVKSLLNNTHINIATVINFPHGKDDEHTIQTAIEAARLAGANECDIVLPYQHLLAGDLDYVASVLQVARQACGAACLKVIIESGELKTSAHIATATTIAADNGADFVKTSTGKTPVGATPAAAKTILKTLADIGSQAGLKVSGGVRTVEDAMSYVQLSQAIMGEQWLSPSHFRLGASSLLKALL